MAIYYIHWDQLSLSLSSLTQMTPDDVVLLCEVKDIAVQVKHHQKKLVLLFSAMRSFKQALIAEGWQVDYVSLTDPNNTQSLVQEIKRAMDRHDDQQLVITEMSEYDIHQSLQVFSPTVHPDTRFLASHEDFQQWAASRKQLRMEYFYREMRKRYQVLITDGKPVGGKWNYDTENRKPLRNDLLVPEPFRFERSEITKTVMALVKEHFSDHFGDIEDFHLATTREEALLVLHDFVENRLVDFGTYQDAMLQGNVWLYHSHISFYLNIGLLLPIECITLAEKAYVAKQAPLNAVEGFIRQILGWREYIRGLYWLKMPGYVDENYFQATRPLPDFFWTGDTPMNCISQVVKDTRQFAYAHHIQRLMVMGNFSLLAGLDPKHVNEWFWVVYADAYQWVELPNVSGMALFADGGVLASKPYCSSGAYINKMSNYCNQCVFNVKEKTGAQACPFNYLYWYFLIRHEKQLRPNPRLAFMYRQIDKMSVEHRQAIEESAIDFLQK